MLQGSHRGRPGQKDCFCCRTRVLYCVSGNKNKTKPKKGDLWLRNLSPPFPLGTHHLSTYIQNTFQLSHAWEDTAILLVLLYNWLGLPNPAMFSTDTPPRPGALPPHPAPPASFWGYGSEQSRLQVRTKQAAVCKTGYWGVRSNTFCRNGWITGQQSGCISHRVQPSKAEGKASTLQRQKKWMR